MSAVKRCFVLLFFMVGLLYLTGCTTDYDRDDIEKWIQEELQISGVSVARQYREVKGSDGYTDRLWDVIVPETGLRFHVLDDYYWGMESMSNSLSTDYNEAVLDMIKDKLPELAYLEVSTATSGEMYTGEITGNFENTEQLQQCYSELQYLCSAFEKIGYHNLSVRYSLCFQNPLREKTEYTVDDGDSIGYTDNIDTFEEMKNSYIITVLDYRFEQADTFLQEEIATALTDYRYRAGIYRGMQTDRALYEPEQITYYDDIIANKYAYGISFGSLYHILVKEGFAVSGNSWHYSFVGANGVQYEISYDFVSELEYRVGEVRAGYYYVANGAIVPMDAYFYNHFDERQIEQMTGLRVVDHVYTSQQNQSSGVGA